VYLITTKLLIYKNNNMVDTKIIVAGLVLLVILGVVLVLIFSGKEDKTPEKPSALSSTGTGTVTDPETGVVTDTETGAVTDPETGVVTDTETGAVTDNIPDIAFEKLPGIAEQNRIFQACMVAGHQNKKACTADPQITVIPDYFTTEENSGERLGDIYSTWKTPSFMHGCALYAGLKIENRNVATCRQMCESAKAQQTCRLSFTDKMTQAVKLDMCREDCDADYPHIPGENFMGKPLKPGGDDCVSACELASRI
jgi:hypothetical protein